MSGKTYRIAIIKGDGIGPEVIDAAMTVLAAVTKINGISIATTELDGGADTYARTGTSLSMESMEVIQNADATLKGPVGLPDVRYETAAGHLGGVLRNGFDLYASVRPILLLPGVTSALRVDPGSIDYVIIRENTEGLYASQGKGVGNEWAVADTLLVTRNGCERVARYAFDVAGNRSGAPSDGVQRVTLVDKANVLRSMSFFRDIFLEVAEQYPSIEAECFYVDAAAQALVMQPSHFDVIVTENLFGDILSDLGGGTVGGISLCPAGNIGEHCAYFEPVHGSAPSIAGKGKANPVGQILSVAMMLDYLGEHAAGSAIHAATMGTLADGSIVIDELGAAIGGPEVAAEAIVDHLTA